MFVFVNIGAAVECDVVLVLVAGCRNLDRGRIRVTTGRSARPTLASHFRQLERVEAQTRERGEGTVGGGRGGV